MLMALTEAATVVSVDVVRAIDGDTLVVTVDDSLRKLRRLGIDAPEYDQDGSELRSSLRNFESQNEYGYKPCIKRRFQNAETLQSRNQTNSS